MEDCLKIINRVLFNNNNIFKSIRRARHGGRLRQEDCKFVASLSYILSCKTAWATYQDPVSENQKHKNKRKSRESKFPEQSRGHFK
jgi:hypothetical protein